MRQEEALHNPAKAGVEQVLTESLFSKRVDLVTMPGVLEVMNTVCSVQCTAVQRAPAQAEATQSAAPWPGLSWAQSRSSPASQMHAWS